MSVESTIQRAFTSGEVSPALGARADQLTYLTGLRRCRNFIVRRQGGVWNRPGTQFVVATKHQDKVGRLVPFVFEAADQTYLLEFGEEYVRFIWHGAPVVVAHADVTAWSGATAYTAGVLAIRSSVVYVCVLAHTNQQPPNATYWYALPAHPTIAATAILELPTPFQDTDLAALQWGQTADVVTIVHRSYPPRELQRLGHTTWAFVVVTTAPSIDAPTSPIGTPGPSGTRTIRYVATFTKLTTLEESYASTVVTLANVSEPTIESPHVLSAAGNAEADEIHWHKDPYGNGIYGYIGSAPQGVAFNDVGFVPDYTVTPPTETTLFDSSGNYPGVVGAHKQRQAYGGSTNQRETIWLSQIGARRNFSRSTPLQDDDAVEFILASQTVNPVMHLIGRENLIILSDAGEWIAYGNEGGALTPTSINPLQVGFRGSSSVRPVLVDDAVLFVPALGTGLRSFDPAKPQGTGSQELSTFANHLVETYQLRELAYARHPHAVVWAVRSDGTLLGLTYVPEHEVLAWHRHDTAASGVFESIAVIPDTTSGEDRLYAIIRRTIDGSTVRYIERFAPRIATVANGVFMDVSVSYSGSAETAFSGLDHLEGEVVAVLGDGVVVYDGDPDGDDAGDFTVTGGAITLPAARTVVHVGLAIRHAEIETLDLDVQGTAVRDKRKRVQGFTLLVEQGPTRFKAGPDSDHLADVAPEPWEVTAGTEMVTEAAREGSISSRFTVQGRVLLRHTQPLPFSITGVMPSVEVGG